jgi:tetratricopeptide (TPR) repeat protein
MDETKQVESLSAIAEAEARRARTTKPAIATVRVSPGPYLALGSVATFCSALLLRANHDGWALVLIISAWILLPLIALTDRIAFDGGALRRQNPLSLLLQLFRIYPKQLAVDDFETVETSAVRTLRRGGSVRYRYRTEINGKGKQFVIASGGKSYRKLVRELFPLIHEDKLDNRSRDLRDYLSDPRSVHRKTQLSKLAPENILDLAKSEFKLGGKSERSDQSQAKASGEDLERAHLLRRLGNELRVSGRLREAREAFRRALNVTPRRAWLIYDRRPVLIPMRGCFRVHVQLSAWRVAELEMIWRCCH